MVRIFPFVFIWLFLLFAQSAHAFGIIRDTETEDLIRDYARPIFRAAGITGSNIKIHLISKRSFNAFVVDGQNMFLHVGAIMSSKTPNQLIGVIAHETGHIIGGHLPRLRAQMARAKTTSLMLQILSIAAMAGQAAIGGSSNDLGEAGAAIMHGGNTLAMRSVLAYRRAEESAADQAAAMLLNATKQSTRGMLETFEYFAEQGLGSLHHVDPYIQSHPMPRQRMVQLRNLAKSSPYYDKLDTVTLQRRHDMVKAKLAGFLDNPRTVLKRYPQHDNSLPAQYARAVAYYRSSGIGSFLPRIEAMIKSRPDNPYLYELKGQFLFESGRAKAAIAPLQKAVQMLPESGIIRIALAQAMLAYGEGGNVSEAIVHLRKALVKEDSSANGFRQLAIAYGRKNKIADAELASAQAYFYEGKLALAKKQAKRALEKFKRGSPAWIKANDIINFQKPK